VVLQALVFNNKQIYLFLCAVPEQKLDFFAPYMAAFYIIIVDHNIIDSSRCLIIIVQQNNYIFAIFQVSQKTSFLRNLFDDRINTLQTKCVL
jgi:hypothetical protein